ncbi:MAG: nucleotidyltransferase family protein [Nitrospirales bacterium]|nr:nucleotidyltransferase family protein [Nitrospirales bacterium]
MSVLSPDKLVEAYALVGSANRRSLEALAIVLTQFRACGIDCLLLKGADILPRLYGVWGLRPMVDADLLVRERDLPAIDRIVRKLGYLPQIDGNPAYRAPDHSLLLDLTTEIWYTEDTESLWKRAVQRDLEGLPVKGMGSEDLLIFLTAYAVLYRGCFSPAFPKDLALLVRKEPLDWEFVLEEACRRNLKIPLYYGLSYAAGHEPIALPPEVMRRLAPAGPAENALAFTLRKLVLNRPVNNLGHFLLFVTRPAHKKWGWLQRYLFPSTAFLQYRYGEHGTRNPHRTRLLRACALLSRTLILSVTILARLLTSAPLAGPARP